MNPTAAPLEAAITEEVESEIIQAYYTPRTSQVFWN
jgi:hypothetical protein